MNGWIKLHNKFLQWEWAQIPEMAHLFIHFLLLANYKENNWQGIKIMPGQLIVGRKKLAETTGISEQTIRTCLTRLKSTNEITIKSTNKYSVITIVNWAKYQGKENKSTSKSTSNLTNNQPATNQQLTTPKEGKNNKNDKNTPPVAVSNNSWTKDILIWLEEKREIKFADYGKQLSALGRLKKSGYTPEQIKAIMLIMEKDNWWMGKNPDFVNLAANVHKFIKKEDDLWRFKKSIPR